MEAIRFIAKTGKIEYGKIPMPKIKQINEVLIKVAYSGVCGTDIHIIKGEFPCKTDGPVVLGHESSGVVVEVGEGVKTLKKGDHVSIDPNQACHNCNYCRTGNPHYCKTGAINNTLGIYRDGGWAEYMIAPEEEVHKIPDGMSLEQAALGEPISCIVHGWDVLNPVPIGQKILILGAGVIGNLWMVNLHHQGHRHVTISEPNQNRLDAVKKLKTNFNLMTPDQLDKIFKENPINNVYDLIIDCSGYPPAIEKAISYLGYGGKMCIFGVSPPNKKISLSPYEIYQKELKIMGVAINPLTFPKALGLMQAMGERYLNYDILGIKTYPLSEYELAFNNLKEGKIAKAMFKC